MVSQCCEFDTLRLKNANENVVIVIDVMFRENLFCDIIFEVMFDEN